MAKSAYVTAQYRDDPLGFLISLMYLKRHEPTLRQLPESLHILTGLVTYRCLPRMKKEEVLGQVLKRMRSPTSSHDVKRLMGHLYGTFAKLTANPYWYAWSLSDAELRDYYSLNDDFSKAIEFLGLDFGSSISVVGLATGMVAVSRQGITQAAVAGLKDKANINLATDAGRLIGLSPHAIKSLGFAAAMVTIFAGVMHAQTKQSSEQAKRELMARGLLKVDEM